MPEPLIRTTVSGWLNGDSLPGRNKLLTFLKVCGVPAVQWEAWFDAVAQVRSAPPGRSIGEHEAGLLGVHNAIHVDPDGADADELGDLTPYVVRNHDHELREVLHGGREIS